MLEAFSAKPWRARRLVDQLAGLALRLHALPTTGSRPTTPRSWTTGSSLPRHVVAELDRPELAAALARAEELGRASMDGPTVVCHGDFHPLNVMVDGERASVIDWTDAGLGPREADVARTLLLFHIAAIAAGCAVERAVLKVAGPRLARRYRRTYEAGSRSIPDACRRGRCCTPCTGGRRSRCCTPAASTARRAPTPGRVPLSLRDFLRSRIERNLAML